MKIAGGGGRCWREARSAAEPARTAEMSAGRPRVAGRARGQLQGHPAAPAAVGAGAGAGGGRRWRRRQSGGDAPVTRTHRRALPSGRCDPLLSDPQPTDRAATAGNCRHGDGVLRLLCAGLARAISPIWLPVCAFSLQQNQRRGEGLRVPWGRAVCARTTWAPIVQQRSNLKLALPFWK